MIVKQIEVGNMQNFSYIIADEDSKEAAIVDPGWESDMVMGEVENDGYKVTHILLTHSHYDHAQEVENVFRRTNAKVCVHDAEKKPFMLLHGVKVLKDGDKIKIGKLVVKVHHTPGHCPGAVCYEVEGNLFTGDTLFIGSIGRTDLPGSNPPDMEKSLAKLKKLPDDMKVYPGHDYGSQKSSTIAYEKENNPYMK